MRLPKIWRKATQTEKNKIPKALMQNETKLLANYIGEQQAEKLLPLLVKNKCILKITKSRKTKFGDYRPPLKKGHAHQITVNGNLNKYAFLITLLHEIAHLQVYQIFKSSCKPHGTEWKTTFSLLLHEAIADKVFPTDIELPLRKYMINPKASTASDIDLYSALKKHDSTSLAEQKTLLKQLNIGEQFRLGKKFFEIEKKNRTRFSCLELNTGKKYFVHQLAEVEILEKNEEL